MENNQQNNDNALDNQAKLTALSNAITSLLEYRQEGLTIAIQLLKNETGQMRLKTYDLIWEQLDQTAKHKFLQYLAEDD